MQNNFDVIVIGGGPAGIGAALAAAKHGQKVLLLERDNALGGALNNMLIMPFMEYYTPVRGSENPFYLVQGIFEEIIDRYIALKKELEGENTDYAKKPIFYFNDEYMKIVFAQMMKEYGVQVLYHAFFLSADCKAKEIKQIKAVVNGKEMLFKGKIYIDCTGNADVAYKAEFPTRLGREQDGLCQPMTLCFRIGNVNMEAYKKCLWNEETNSALLNDLYIEAKKKGEIDIPRENVLMFTTVHEGVVHFNTTRIIKRNPVDPIELSLAEEEGRKQVLQMFRFLRKYIPGCENAALLQTASHIGIRESRMIDGEYVLTGEDIVNCTKFEDGIAACNYDIDIHNPDGVGTSHHYFKPYTYYTIPYRCLVPKGSKNLLVAGRCISGTHEAQASYRVMPFAVALGEAAGVAAYVAIKNQQAVCQTAGGEVVSLLRQNGAFVEKEIPNKK